MKLYFVYLMDGDVYREEVVILKETKKYYVTKRCEASDYRKIIPKEEIGCIHKFTFKEEGFLTTGGDFKTYLDKFIGRRDAKIKELLSLIDKERVLKKKLGLAYINEVVV